MHKIGGSQGLILTGFANPVRMRRFGTTPTHADFQYILPGAVDLPQGSNLYLWNPHIICGRTSMCNGHQPSVRGVTRVPGVDGGFALRGRKWWACYRSNRCRCWTVLTPCISVEATAKGLAPHRYVESSNEPLRRRAPIETSTYLCGVNPAKLLAFEMHKIGGSQGLILTDVAS